MRLRITLDDELVSAIDHRVGRQKRNAFIALVTRRAIANERSWAGILASLGKVDGTGHDWDKDPAAWVRTQRRGDSGRVG
ncbi:MAG: hypothetical protein AUH39_04355 [Chloroflexi bacterium 13_1_40CM_67_9]|nr:MAG: hypothetical protein AUH39_04355 [Chloroflexi bacterium 13_1_40CM_67_9]